MSTSDDSFMKSLFFGQIREDMVFPYPRFSDDLSETVAMILESIHGFATDRVQSAEWDDKGEMPEEIVEALCEMDMTGLAVPEELGGLGLPQCAYARVMQEVASVDPSVAVTLGAHQSIGYKALLLFGSDEQKQRLLPRLATGELFACYALTEAGAGSDAASIKTRAVLSDDGSHYVVNGSKLWITNAGIATFVTFFAKTAVEVNGKTEEKVTCFCLELPAQGVSIGPPEHKMGIRASWTNEIHFEDVKVPAENVIGEPGKGFKIAMGVLNHGRLGLAAGCVGGAKLAIKASVEHATEREQFKKRLIDFGMIQEKIARMVTRTFVAESMVYMTTALIDRGDVDYSLESAICKIYSSEALWEILDENLQIWGGSGYMKEYPFERWLRDSRINLIFEGTNEILRAFVALSGMQGPGEDLAKLGEAIKYPLKGMGPVTDFAVRRFRQTVFGESISEAHPRLKRLAGTLEANTVEFSQTVEKLLRQYGRKIHLEQMAQKRIADIAIDLYANACLISRITSHLEQDGPEKCELQLAMAESFINLARRRMRGNFKALERNEDEAKKLIASNIAQLGRYPYDILEG